jgi:hypothetical protein
MFLELTKLSDDDIHGEIREKKPFMRMSKY